MKHLLTLLAFAFCVSLSVPAPAYAKTDDEAAADAKGNNGAEGTYKYRGEWGSLDHILLRGNIKRHLQTTHINDLPFLLQGEEEQKMPRRTYRGNFYQGGYSDHLPLVATFAF